MISEVRQMANEGQSFNDHTYSAMPMTYALDTTGIKYINVPNSRVQFVRAYDPSYIDIKVGKVSIADHLQAFYIKEIAVCDNLADTFLVQLGSETFIHAVCDLIKEKCKSRETSFALQLPDEYKNILSVMRNLSGLPTSYSIPIKPHIPTGEDTIPVLRVQIVDELLDSTGIKARNFDFYLYYTQIIDGLLATQTYIAPYIELFFNKLCYTTEIIELSEERERKKKTSYMFGKLIERNEYEEEDLPTHEELVDFNSTPVIVTPKSMYAAETYELKTIAALNIGKAIGYKDTVNDVLGRVTSDSLCREFSNVPVSELMFMYKHYIESVGAGRSTFSLTRPEALLLDSYYDASRTIIKEKRVFGTDYLKVYKYEIYRTEQIAFKNTLRSTAFFHPLSEQINLIREAALQSLPTDTIKQRLNLMPEIQTLGEVFCMAEVDLNKALYVTLGDDDFFLYSVYAVADVFKEEDNIKEKLLRTLKTDKSFVPVTFNIKYTTQFPVPILAKSSRMCRIDTSGVVGDVIEDIPCTNMPYEKLRLNLSVLKAFLYQKMQLADSGLLDLSQYIEICNKVKPTQELEYYLPDNWRKYQITDLDIENGCKSYFFKRSDPDKTDLTGRVEPVGSIQAFKNVSIKKTKDILREVPYCHDPATLIRTGLSTVNDNEKKVSAFETPSEADNLEVYKYPINYYTCICNSNNELIVPMLSSFVCLGKDIISNEGLLKINVLSRMLEEYNLFSDFQKHTRYL